jgi:hypothetical protein
MLISQLPSALFSKTVTTPRPWAPLLRHRKRQTLVLIPRPVALDDLAGHVDEEYVGRPCCVSPARTWTPPQAGQRNGSVHR